MTAVRSSGFASKARHARCLCLLAGLLAFVVPPSERAEAAVLGVAPIRVELSSDGTPTVVRVRNQGPESVLVQVHAVAWGADVDSAPIASEILAVPPVFELAGEAEQVIRVAARRPLEAPVERAYRLLITEVPRATGPPNALVFAVRLSLPVFVTPEGAKADPVWSLRGPGGARELVLANRGGAHVRIERLSLLNDGASEPMLTIEEAAYVLAGAEKAWPVDLPAGAVETMRVKAETSLGALEAQVALPGG